MFILICMVSASFCAFVLYPFAKALSADDVFVVESIKSTGVIIMTCTFGLAIAAPKVYLVHTGRGNLSLSEMLAQGSGGSTVNTAPELKMVGVGADTASPSLHAVSVT